MIADVGATPEPTSVMRVGPGYGNAREPADAVKVLASAQARSDFEFSVSATISRRTAASSTLSDLRSRSLTALSVIGQGADRERRRAGDRVAGGHAHPRKLAAFCKALSRHAAARPIGSEP
ncbi:hypothetical protein [Lysobacter sp. CA199]|uniref:hypothetical protein n=1 Tax=Lysobacter sp. CA199 TaxID=3455608 RepID=UPI003F8D2CDC